MQNKFCKKMLATMLARLVYSCSIWQSSDHEYYCHGYNLHSMMNARKTMQ